MIPRFKKPPKPITPLKSQSSNVVAFTHDPAKGDLDVTFHGGRIYRYKNVSVNKAHELEKADSKGGYLNQHIIPHHLFQRIK